MNFTDLNFNFSLVQWLVTAAIAIYSWLMSRQAASSKELLELRTRIISLENQIKHVPTQHQVTQLIEKLGRNEAHLSGLSDRLSGLSHQLDNINQFLLKNK